MRKPLFARRDGQRRQLLVAMLFLPIVVSLHGFVLALTAISRFLGALS